MQNKPIIHFLQFLCILGPLLLIATYLVPLDYVDPVGSAFAITFLISLGIAWFFRPRPNPWFYTRGGRLIMYGGMFLLVSALFRLQHWPYSFQLLIAGVAIVLVGLTWHKLTKPRRELWDLLEWLWLFSFCLIWVLNSVTVVPDHFMPIPHLFFWPSIWFFAQRTLKIIERDAASNQNETSN